MLLRLLEILNSEPKSSMRALKPLREGVAIVAGETTPGVPVDLLDDDLELVVTPEDVIDFVLLLLGAGGLEPRLLEAAAGAELLEAGAAELELELELGAGGLELELE
jgi:hypothetical protein